MHRKAHISQGFKQGLQIGCGGSQMTSGPQFPPCGIEKLWSTLFGEEARGRGGCHLPLNTCWRWMDPHSPKMHIPTASCIRFRGGDLGIPNSNPRFLRFKIDGLGELLFFLQIRKFLQIINDPLCTRTLFYSLQSAFNPHKHRQGRKLRRRLLRDPPKVTGPAGG